MAKRNAEKRKRRRRKRKLKRSFKIGLSVFVAVVVAGTYIGIDIYKSLNAPDPFGNVQPGCLPLFPFGNQTPYFLYFMILCRCDHQTIPLCRSHRKEFSRPGHESDGKVSCGSFLNLHRALAAELLFQHINAQMDHCRASVRASVWVRRLRQIV